MCYLLQNLKAQDFIEIASQSPCTSVRETFFMKAAILGQKSQIFQRQNFPNTFTVLNWSYLLMDVRASDGNGNEYLPHYHKKSNRKAFQSKSNCPLANRCIGYKGTSLNRSGRGMEFPSEKV